MRRNILRRTLSEDLTWADLIKNEHHIDFMVQNPKNMTTRSLHSTPERKVVDNGDNLSDFDDFAITEKKNGKGTPMPVSKKMHIEKQNKKGRRGRHSKRSSCTENQLGTVSNKGNQVLEPSN